MYRALCKLQASTTECEGRKMSLLRECVRELRILRRFGTSNQVDTYQRPEKLTAGHFHLDLTQKHRSNGFFAYGICQSYGTSLLENSKCATSLLPFFEATKLVGSEELRFGVCEYLQGGATFLKERNLGLGAWFFCF